MTKTAARASAAPDGVAAFEYADQNARDHEALVQAVADGRVQATANV